MRLVVDSSALAKRYVLDDGSEEIDAYLQGCSELALCVVLVPEIVSALNRRLRENALSAIDYGRAKRQLMEDVSDAVVLQLTPAVIVRSVRLLETNVLRVLDALHVACALEWSADFFVTADGKQYAAAKNSELRAEYIG